MVSLISWTNKTHQNQSLQDSSINALLLESRRLLEESKSKDLSRIAKPDRELSPELNEIFENLSSAFQNYQARVYYNNMK